MLWAGRAGSGCCVTFLVVFLGFAAVVFAIVVFKRAGLRMMARA